MTGKGKGRRDCGTEIKGNANKDRKGKGKEKNPHSNPTKTIDVLYIQLMVLNYQHFEGKTKEVDY